MMKGSKAAAAAASYCAMQVFYEVPAADLSNACTGFCV